MPIIDRVCSHAFTSAFPHQTCDLQPDSSRHNALHRNELKMSLDIWTFPFSLVLVMHSNILQDFNFCAEARRYHCSICRCNSSRSRGLYNWDHTSSNVVYQTLLRHRLESSKVECCRSVLTLTFIAYYWGHWQELLALGMCNVFGSFFSCYPSGPSLSRSAIYDEVGAKTQVGSRYGVWLSSPDRTFLRTFMRQIYT